MRKLLFLTLVLPPLLLTSGWTAGQENTTRSQVEVIGTTQGNAGCAILEKHTPVKGKLLAVGVIYARTEYRVLESFSYQMPKSKFTGQGEIEELNRLAVRDKVKLVVVPSKHTPEQLDEARTFCGEPPESRSPRD